MADGAPSTQTGTRTSWAVFAAFLALYLLTATRTVQGGDTAEFVTVAATGGLAHPPGYPLFGALARLFAQLPIGPMAFRVTALTAVTAAATLGVVHRLLLRWTADRLAALVGAAALGTSFLFWHWSTVAEVLPLGALTTALVVAAAFGSVSGARGPKQGLLVGLAAATGIANHHTVILLLPLCLLGWIAALPRPLDARSAIRTTAATTAGVLAGFVPYLWFLTIDSGGWVWGDTTTLSGVVHHFLRADYGSFSIPQGGATPWWTWPVQYTRELASEFGGALWLLAPIGLIARLRANKPGDRWLLGALIGSWFLCGPVLLSQFTYPTTGFHHAVVERFALQPNVLVAVCVGLGAAEVRRWSLWSRPWLPGLLLGLNLAGLVLLNGTRAGWSSHTVLQDFLDNTLRTVEQSAILITSGDAQTFGFVYAQEVNGTRLDVAPISHVMLHHRWYRERLLARHPDLVLEQDGRALSLRGVVAANIERRPIYITPRLFPQLQEGGFPPTWPATTMLRFVAPGEPLPPPAVVHERLAAAMEQWQINSRILHVSECDHSLECTTWDQYALVLDTLASGWAVLGAQEQADALLGLAKQYSPWLFEAPTEASTDVRGDQPTGTPTEAPAGAEPGAEPGAD